MAREKVDNSGRGNCMYYAYSISLMYFLLNKRNPELAERIFTRLELTKEHKEKLHSLLNKPIRTGFTIEISTIIEPILGPATRKIASQRVKEELIHSPNRSALIAAIDYGMLYLFRRKLEQQDSPLAALFADQEFELPNYTEAEIYKVFNITKANSELHQHIDKHFQTILDEYYQKLPDELDEVYQEKLKRLKRTITETYSIQQQFIKDLLGVGKFNFPQVINQFTHEWDLFIDKAYEESDKSLSKTALANQQALQYEFLRKLLPKAEFRDAIDRFPSEWEAYVTKIEQEGIFTKAEIKANTRHQQIFRKEITEKTVLPFDVVIAYHREAWSAHIENIYEQRKDSVSKAVINLDPFYHNRLLSRLIHEKTLDFFTANNNSNIDKYAKHLNQNYQWGSEETLLTLHSYLQDPIESSNGRGGVNIEYQDEMLLELYESGVPKSGVSLRHSDLILNNIGNFHWVSLVEPARAVASPVVNKTTKEEGKPVLNVTPVKKPDEAQVKGTDATSVKKTDATSVKKTDATSAKKTDLTSAKKTDLTSAKKTDLTSAKKTDLTSVKKTDLTSVKKTDLTSVKKTELASTKKTAVTPVKKTDVTPVKETDVTSVTKPVELPIEMPIITPVNTRNVTPFEKPKQTALTSPIVSRMDHLVFCGFDVYLKQLRMKAAELTAKHPEASKEAFELCARLEEEQKQFIAPNSTISAQAFAKKCQTIIKEAPKAQLETHRGVGMIFNGMLNALIFLANMIIGAGNLIFGRFELIDSNRIKTESIQQVNSIDVSLEALKAIRAREMQKALAKEEKSALTTSEKPTLGK